MRIQTPRPLTRPEPMPVQAVGHAPQPADRIALGERRTDALAANMQRLRETARAARPAAPPSYAPPGRYLWDSWVLRDDSVTPPLYRLFHLDAPQTPDPEARHDQARVRQAVSTDLRTWTDVGEALGPGDKGRWDDQAIWTGNVYRAADGGYRFFYTGRNQRDGQLQRIGLAKSSDGVHFSRSEHALLEPDGRWYETTETSPVYKAWRDPTVGTDSATGEHVMLFTARTREGDSRYNGCIGAARASHLDGPYTATAPVLAPGRYAQMEVPQVIERNGKVYLFFSCWASDYAPAWAEATGGGQSGLHAWVGDSLTGPFSPVNGDGVVTRTDDNLYTVKLVDDPSRPGEYTALGWYVNDRPGEKALTLSPPIPVTWEGDRITLAPRDPAR